MYALMTKRYTNVKKKVQRNYKCTCIIKHVGPVTYWAPSKSNCNDDDNNNRTYKEKGDKYNTDVKDD